MAEKQKKPWKATEDAGNLIAVDANRLREALKHTFEGVTMLFDCIGVDVPVGESVAEPEGKHVETIPEEQAETIPVEEHPEDQQEIPTAEAPKRQKPEEPPAEPVATASAVTQDDITRIIVRKIKQDRSNNEKIGAILKTYAVAKVSDLPAAKYEAFLTDVSQI